jgi:hypothetical protein
MPKPAGALSRLSQGELDLLIAGHERLLEGKPGGKRLCLPFYNLDGLDFSGRNLAEADFSGSHFQNGKLAKAVLDRANLFGCDMRGADLRAASLKRADMRGVSLRGANLSLADLTQADFREGQIAVRHAAKGLSLVKREVRAGDLEEVNFSGATLDGSQTAPCAAPGSPWPTSKKPTYPAR